MALNVGGTVKEDATTQAPHSGFARARMGGLVNRTWNPRQTTERLRDIVRVFDKITEENGGDVGHDYIIVDTNETGGHVGIIGVTRYEDSGKTVSVIPLLVAATASPLKDLVLNVRGTRETYTIPQVVGDIWNRDIVRRRFEEILKARYPEKQISILAPVVLPTEFDIENTSMVYGLLSHLYDSNELFLNYVGEFQSGALSINELTNQSTLHVAARYGQLDTVDLFGRPFRSDVVVEVQQQVKTNYGIYGSNDQDQTEVTGIVSAKGYLDAIYAGQRPDPRDTTWTESNINSFLPVFVMTDVSIEGEQLGLTMSHMALTIASLCGVANEDSWLSGFRPNRVRPDVYVGNLCKEIPAVGTPINLSGEQQAGGPLNDPDYISVGQHIFHCANSNRPTQPGEATGLVFMMDIDESGVKTPTFSILLEAAKGDVNALNVFIAGADDLTNNNFSKHWNAMGRPALFGTTNLRLPVGKVTLGKGENPVDTRTIDQVFVDSSEDDINVMIDNNENFYASNLPADKRTESIYRYQSTRFSPEYHTYVQRIVIYPALVDLLLTAIAECGKTIVVEDNKEVNRRNELRRGANYAGFSIQRGQGPIVSPYARATNTGVNDYRGYNTSWSQVRR